MTCSSIINALITATTLTGGAAAVAGHGGAAIALLGTTTTFVAALAVNHFAKRAQKQRAAQAEVQHERYLQSVLADPTRYVQLGKDGTEKVVKFYTTFNHSGGEGKPPCFSYPY